MFELLNQYSYVWISLFIVVAVLLFLRGVLHLSWRIIIPVEIALVLILTLALLILRPGVSDVSSSQAAEALLSNGRPTFLEFFSNYCTGCVAIRPRVDQIAAELKEDFNILRVDIHTTAGRTLRETLGFSYTPEFIIFNNFGEEIWREHYLPPTEILQSAQLSP